MLTQWSDQGKVRLDDTTLTLLQENRTVKLKPAVRFTKLIDGGDDPNKLIGKVKTPEQLAEMKAEHYLDSVILGDVGYQVVEGYLGDLSPPPKGAKPATKPGQKPSDSQKSIPRPVETQPSNDLEKEAESLASLFLDTVKDR